MERCPEAKPRVLKQGELSGTQDVLPWDTAAKNKSRQGIVGGKAMSVTPCKSTQRGS